MAMAVIVHLKGSNRKRNSTCIVSPRGQEGVDGQKGEEQLNVGESFPAIWYCLKMEQFVLRGEFLPPRGRMTSYQRFL